MRMSTPPTCRTVTARRWCWPKSSSASRDCAMSSPRGDMLAASSGMPSGGSANGPSRSSNGRMPQRGLSSCLDAESSNAYWLGSIGTAASQKASSRPHRHGFLSPRSSSSHAVSQGHEITSDNYVSDSEAWGERRQLIMSRFWRQCIGKPPLNAVQVTQGASFPCNFG